MRCSGHTPDTQRRSDLEPVCGEAQSERVNQHGSEVGEDVAAVCRLSVAAAHLPHTPVSFHPLPRSSSAQLLHPLCLSP